MNVINAAQYYVSGSLNTYFNVPVVGAVNMALDSAGTSYLWPALDEEGLPFESSLTIAVTVSGTAYVAHAYKLV